MTKGERVILLVLAYCLISWWARGYAGAPSPLLTPVQVADLFEPSRSVPDGTMAFAPHFTRPVAELVSVPMATAATEEKAPPTTWEGFLGKLRDLERRDRSKVRVIHLGDSELVADGTAGAARRVLAERFGLGGLGFSLPALPLPWYLREHLEIREGTGIAAFSYPHGRLAGGMYGPGGVAFDAAPGAHAWVEARHPRTGGCTVELFFSQIPRGGTLQVVGDGALILEVDTAGSYELRSVRGRVAACPSAMELVTSKRHTRFYGWSIEYDAPGIVWSNLGVVSAQIPQLDHFAEGHLSAAMRALDPDLVVFTYGLNLAASSAWPPPQYRFVVEDQIRRVRAGATNAACLVTGPYPVGHAREGAGHNPESKNAKLITDGQKAAAEAAGCAFVDRFSLAGGAAAASHWVAARPKILSGDYHHLTLEGSERMGHALAALILASVDGQEVNGKRFQLARKDWERAP